MAEISDRLKCIADQCVCAAEETTDHTTAARLLPIALRLMKIACPELRGDYDQISDDRLEGEPQPLR